MPKFIGRRIEGATRIEDNAFEDLGRVNLTYAQARLLPAETILCSLDTTDRGSRGSLAKRWYRFFASPADILAAPRVTTSMRRRVDALVDRLKRRAARELGSDGD